MQVILHSRACPHCQTTHKVKTFLSHLLGKESRDVAPPKIFMVSRNCKSPNLKHMKSLAF